MTREHDVRWRSVSFVALIAGVLLASLATSNLTAFGFDEPVTQELFFTPKLLLLSAALLISSWAWMMDVRRGASVRPVPFQSLMAFAFGAAALSTAFGIQPLQSLMGSDSYGQGLLAWMLYLLLIYLTVQLVRSHRHARELAAAVVVSSSLIAAYALVQVLGLDPFVWPGTSQLTIRHGISTIGNPDMVASYLLFGLVLSPVLALTDHDRRTRIAYWTAFALIAASWALATSRTAWVAGIVALTITVLTARRAGSKRLGPVIVSAGAAALVAGAAMLISRSDALARLAQLVTAPMTAGGSRWLLYETAGQTIAERPLLGGGPDSFRFLWYPLRQAADLAIGGFNGVADDPHSLPLLLAATLGVPAALALLGVALGALWRTRSAVISPAGPESRDGTLMLAAWWIAVAAYGATSLFGVLVVPNAVVLAIGIGVLLASVSKRESNHLASRILPYVVLTASAVALVFMSFQYASDYLIARSNFAPGQRAVELASDAQRLMPFTYRARLRTAESLEQQATAAVVIGTANASYDVARASDAYRRLIAWNPDEYESYKRYLGFLVSTATATKGDDALSEALDIAKRGLAVQPYGLSAGYFGASAAMGLGRADEAAGFLAPVWDLDPNAPAAAGILYTEALLEAGRHAEARDVAGTMLQRYPGDPDVLALAERLGVLAR